MENFQILKFDKGQTVFHDGESGGYAYLIRSGKIALTKSIKGTKQAVAQMNPGQILGEMAIITGEPRSATAEAIEPSELLIIDQEAFQTVLRKSTPFIKALINQLISRILASEKI